MKKVVVIGAGAAGLMAAITAAENGSEVIVLEHKESIGKKLRATGNGKCNFTNIKYNTEFVVNEGFFRSDNINFVKEALSILPSDKTIEYFKERGMSFIERDGYVYPRSEQATSVVDFFSERCKLLGVEFIFKAEVKKIINKDEGFEVEYILENKRTSVGADSVIIAAGSKAAAKTGSDGSGYYFAKTLGHNVVTVVPGLVGLCVLEEHIKSLAGVRAVGKISLYVDNNRVVTDEGEIQFTSYGISGIPVFQVSRYAARALEEGKKVTGILDLFTEKTESEIYQDLIMKKQQNQMYSVDVILKMLVNSKIADMIYKCLDIEKDKKMKNLSDRELKRIAEYIKNVKVTIVGTNGFDNAQVCAGGVDTAEICSDTMESKLHKNIYFAGEVMDVDGMCGGYNLQWAWTSGFIAGKSAAK